MFRLVLCSENFRSHILCFALFCIENVYMLMIILQRVATEKQIWISVKPDEQKFVNVHNKGRSVLLQSSEEIRHESTDRSKFQYEDIKNKRKQGK
jgi:hypothetical protein